MPTLLLLPHTRELRRPKNVTYITENICATVQRIRELEAKYNRPAESVRLLAVSKHHSVAKIREAATAGLKEFGENFLQEAEKKITELADHTLTWQFIGPIQSNKTRGIAEHFDWVQSVDRDKIAARLSEQRSKEKPPLNICVQVNLSAEQSKSGTSLAEAESLCALVADLPQLELRGLMAIPAFEKDFEKQRQYLNELSAEFARLQEIFPTMDTLSMGMSNDYEAAIAEQSSMVRLGTVIFGPRV